MVNTIGRPRLAWGLALLVHQGLVRLMALSGGVFDCQIGCRFWSQFRTLQSLAQVRRNSAAVGPDAAVSVKGSGVDGVVYAAALQSDGKVLIGGGFRNYDGAGRSGIARLQNPITVPAPLLVNPILSNHVFKVSLDTVSGKSYVLQFKNSLGVRWLLGPLEGVR